MIFIAAQHKQGRLDCRGQLLSTIAGSIRWIARGISSTCFNDLSSQLDLSNCPYCVMLALYYLVILSCLCILFHDGGELKLFKKVHLKLLVWIANNSRLINNLLFLILVQFFKNIRKRIRNCSLLKIGLSSEPFRPIDKVTHRTLSKQLYIAHVHCLLKIVYRGLLHPMLLITLHVPCLLSRKPRDKMQTTRLTASFVYFKSIFRWNKGRKNLKSNCPRDYTKVFNDITRWCYCCI